MRSWHRRIPSGGLIAWLVLLAVVWIPVELLVFQGLTRTRDTILESAGAILQKALSWDLMRFRHHLQPEIVLTNVLRDALKAAPAQAAPEIWRAQVLNEFRALGSGAVDLLLTDGRVLVPGYPGYDPATLSAFLEKMTERAESLGTVAGAQQYLRTAFKTLDVAGNVRMTQWQWVPLPIWFGISNRCFEDAWQADRVVHINQTPGNSLAGFGRLGPQSPWRYLLLIHRQFMKPAALHDFSCLYASREGLEPAILRIEAAGAGKEARVGPGENAPETPEFGSVMRTGRSVILQEFHPDVGVIQVKGTLPSSLWLPLLLFLVANLAFSVAFLVGAWRFCHGDAFETWRVGPKISLGLMTAGGIPLVLSLLVSEGGIGAAVFRDVQERHLEMEQGLRRLEDQFEVFRKKASESLRAIMPHLPYPYDADRTSRVFEDIAVEVNFSEINILNEEGDLVNSRNSFLWPPYRASFLEREQRLRSFREWVQRGYYLLPDELDMLDLDSASASRMPPAQRLQRIMTFSKRPQIEVKAKVLTALAKPMLRLMNTGSYEETSAGKADSAIMLDMFLKGQAHRFFNEALGSIGNIVNYTYTGFRGLGFFDAIRDAGGRARLLVLAFYRKSDFCENFLYRELGTNAAPKRGIAFDAASLYKGKVHFHARLSFEQKEVLNRLLTDFGTTVRCLLPDENGRPLLVSAVRSEEMPDYVLIASVPFDELADRIWSLHRGRMATLLLLAGMLVPLLIWLRKLLLIPLLSLQNVAEGIRAGRRDIQAMPEAIGEMKVLSMLFQETVDGLKQMDIAKTIQENLLPGKETVLGPCRLVGRTEMMSLVGGDYYDWIPRRGNRYLVVVGDVTGHGLPAAIVVALVKSGLTVLARENLTVSEICAIMNEEMLCNLSRIKMMTCLVGCLDLEAMTFEYCNAGHTYPLVLAAGGGGSYLKQTNLALGSLRKRPFKQDVQALAPGDTVIVYSDGLVEIPNIAGKILGYDGFLERVGRISSRDPVALRDEIFAMVGRHAVGVAPNDDMTVLVISVGAPEAGNKTPVPAPTVIDAPAG